jgi:hypothetical protein
VRTQPAYAVVERPSHDFRPSRLASTKPVVFHPPPKFRTVSGFRTEQIHSFPGMQLPGPARPPPSSGEGEESPEGEEGEGSAGEEGSYEVPHTVVHHYSYDDGEEEESEEGGQSGGVEEPPPEAETEEEEVEEGGGGASLPEEDISNPESSSGEYYGDSLIRDIERIQEEVSRAFGKPLPP